MRIEMWLTTMRNPKTKCEWLEMHEVWLLLGFIPVFSRVRLIEVFKPTLAHLQPKG